MAKLDCGHEPSEHGPHTTGYGEDRDGKRYCYDCCAERERAAMIEHGKATLYLVKDSGYQRPTVGSEQASDRAWIITDWPGKLRFRPWHVRKGRHNIARTRYDAWFAGPDGHVWHGVQYGDMTQIIHCKRTKERWNREAA